MNEGYVEAKLEQFDEDFAELKAEFRQFRDETTKQLIALDKGMTALTGLRSELGLTWRVISKFALFLVAFATFVKTGNWTALKEFFTGP